MFPFAQSLGVRYSLEIRGFGGLSARGTEGACQPLGSWFESRPAETSGCTSVS